MFLADENASNVVSWALPDDEGSIRDVVQYDSATDTTTIVDHLVYDSFGNITSQTNSAFQPLFAYTGMLIDAGSGFYYDQARWYDPQLGKFITQDPSGFAGGDANLYRYVSNSPANFTDPTGMIREIDGGIAAPAGDPGNAAAAGGGILDTVGSMAAGAINAGAAIAGLNPAAMTQAMQEQMNAAMAAAQESMRASTQDFLQRMSAANELMLQTMKQVWDMQVAMWHSEMMSLYSMDRSIKAMCQWMAGNPAYPYTWRMRTRWVHTAKPRAGFITASTGR